VFESAYPTYTEGDVAGWLVIFGVRGEFRAYVDRSDGHTKALQRAADLHGQILPLTVGADFKWHPTKNPTGRGLDGPTGGDPPAG
jgi:hypothetical protein